MSSTEYSMNAVIARARAGRMTGYDASYLGEHSKMMDEVPDPNDKHPDTVSSDLNRELYLYREESLVVPQHLQKDVSVLTINERLYLWRELRDLRAKSHSSGSTEQLTTTLIPKPFFGPERPPALKSTPISRPVFGPERPPKLSDISQSEPTAADTSGPEKPTISSPAPGPTGPEQAGEWIQVPKSIFRLEVSSDYVPVSKNTLLDAMRKSSFTSEPAPEAGFVPISQSASSIVSKATLGVERKESTGKFSGDSLLFTPKVALEAGVEATQRRAPSLNHQATIESPELPSPSTPSTQLASNPPPSQINTKSDYATPSEVNRSRPPHHLSNSQQSAERDRQRDEAAANTQEGTSSSIIVATSSNSVDQASSSAPATFPNAAAQDQDTARNQESILKQAGIDSDTIDAIMDEIEAMCLSSGIPAQAPTGNGSTNANKDPEKSIPDLFAELEASANRCTALVDNMSKLITDNAELIREINQGLTPEEIRECMAQADREVREEFRLLEEKERMMGEEDMTGDSTKSKKNKKKSKKSRKLMKLPKYDPKPGGDGGSGSNGGGMGGATGAIAV